MAAQTQAPANTAPDMAAQVPAPGSIVPEPSFLAPPVMTAKAGGVAYQQFIDKGWTKEQLVAQGYIAP